MGVVIKWEVEDGYVGGARPQETEIDIDDFIHDDEDDLEQILDDVVGDDFETKITYSISNMNEVIAAIKQIKREV